MVDNTYEWELSKENIQPLKHGRNVSNLVSALTNHEDHVKQQRQEQKKALELSIMAYEGQDPLEQWTKYINWLEENYPKGGKEGDLLTVLEQCLEKVRDLPRYHSDPRLLEVYLRYLDLTENSPEWFQQLYGAGYFHNLSCFYINWAEALESRCNFKEGTRVYQLGLENKAEPLAKLEESFKHYQARVASAVFKTMTTMEPTPTPSVEQNRNAFGELDSEGGRAPSHRTGTTVRKFQNNRSLLPSASGSNGGGSKLFNRPVAVLEDENGQPIIPVPVVTGRGGLPIQSVVKAENVVKAGKWTEASGVVNEIIPVAPSLPTFQVHVDDEPVCPPSAQKKQPHEASFSLALKDKAGAAGPGGLKMHNPQSLFERENPKVKLMCDLNRMLVGNREFSYEEIRRQSYERAGRWPTATTSSSIPVAAPSTPSRLLNVPQSSSGSCRSSGKKKKKTPCKAEPPPVFKIPLMNQPPPPLKPNEQWHCNIDSLYRHSDGTELSFEQIRAALYATRYPSVLQPTVTVESPSPVIVHSPETSSPEKKKKETCEMACQTDICGLDYDIIMVPRCKPATVVVDQLEPPSAEKSAGIGSNGPSPTVNTKQALSSVKSWFNSSVLVSATAASQPSPPAAPAKKSLFAIFKDPSMIEQVDSAPPISQSPPPAIKKPFAIFTEEEPPAVVDQENVLPTTSTKLKLRRPLVAIDDENAPPPQIKTEEPETPTEDDFKENDPPADHQPSEQPPTVKRQLSGILQPSIGIPFDPEGERGGEEEDDGRPAPSTHISRALFIEEDDQTRHYAIPVVHDLDGDFTMPSALAFARNLRVQSTPLVHQQRTKPLVASDEGTFVLPRGRTIQQALEQPSSSSTVDQENQQPGPSIPFPPHLSARMGRGLSPIDEMSREYFSSSGSSAGGTTGQQSGLSLSHHLQAGRVYPAHFDPFDLDHRLGQLNSLSLPIEQRQGFQAVSGRQPWLRTHSSVQLGDGYVYVVKQPIGQGAYAKIYEAVEHSGGRKLVLKVQEETGGIWEFYITSELQRRLSNSPTARAVMNVERGFFYDNGSVLVNEFLGHGNLLDLINHYRLKNCSMPEALVYHFALQLLSVVQDVHECGVLHADIKPDNIMLQTGLELFPPELWTTEDILANEQRRPSNVKLIDFGRSVDLALYPDRSAFMHVFNDDKCPEMRDGRAWSYQLDYYGLATTVYTMLMGVHCKIVKVDSQWRLPNLKRGHNNVWKELTTLLLNCPHQMDLEHWRRQLAEQLVASVKAREYNDKIRELERYFASK